MVKASLVGVLPKRTIMALANRAESPVPVMAAAKIKAPSIKKTASLPNRE